MLGARHRRILISLFVVLSISLSHISIYAQIENVQYQIQYNQDSCRFDAFLIINQGTAIDSLERALDYSQFTMIVPAGTLIEIVETYAPLQNNSQYNGVTPIDWIINTVVNTPSVTPESDYYMFSPSYDFQGHFNNLEAGDTIRLFSFTVNEIQNCGAGIRIFDNVTDPGPEEPGMGFVDFDNAVNFLNGSAVFDSVATPINPSPPTIIIPLTALCAQGIEISVLGETTLCQGNIHYEWIGPNNFEHNNNEVTIQNTNSIHDGWYFVTLVDDIGCEYIDSVYAFHKPNAGEDLSVCPDVDVELQGANPISGTWAALEFNPLGVTYTIPSNGQIDIEVENIAIGEYIFTYQYEYCYDTLSIIVHPKPNIEIGENDNICIYDTLQIQPDTAGYWVSGNNSIASISTNGKIVSHSPGDLTFTYTSFATGCQSQTDTISIITKPIVNIVGPEAVCIGSTTLLQANRAGEWFALDSNIATINSEGIVTGLSIGEARFIFIDSMYGCTSETTIISCRNVVVPAFTSVLDLCPNDSTFISPAVDVQWYSMADTVASISNNGRIIGQGAGQTRFYYIDVPSQCMSDTSELITILSKPEITSLDTSICQFSTSQLFPYTTGTWISNDTTIASVGVTTGVYTGLAPGKVTFTYRTIDNQCTETTDTITVRPILAIASSQSSICVGSFATLMASGQGVWQSVEESVAIIVGNQAIGVGNGIVTLQFLDTLSQCQNTLELNVLERPFAGLTDDTLLCVGSTTLVTPNEGGQWFSSNTSIATVTNEGIVTAVNEGKVVLTFLEAATQCLSAPTDSLSIVNLPIIALVGDSILCENQTTLLSSSSIGTWTSSNINILEITSDNIATGHLPGTATLTFTEDITQCTVVLPQNIRVNGPPLAYTNSTSACLGSQINLLASVAGYWISNDTTLATMVGSHSALALAAGGVSFTFVDTSNTCGYTSTTDMILINPCFLHDIHVGRENEMLYGNIATNDPPNGYVYLRPIVSKQPSGSNTSIIMEEDGQYTFTADKRGRYVIQTEVCPTMEDINCPISRLFISLTDSFAFNTTVVANPDIAQSITNQPIEINLLANDVCLQIGENKLNTTSITFLDSGNSSLLTYNPNEQSCTYISNLSFVGIDTVRYLLCDETLVSCDTGFILIFVKATESSTQYVATDDCYELTNGDTLLATLTINDNIPNGQLFSIIPQDSTDSFGHYTISSEGAINYVSHPNFKGTVVIPYTLCDENNNCTKATAYIYVINTMRLKLRTYLEGAFLNHTAATHEGRYLMTDNLRVSPFDGSRQIPNLDPHSNPQLYFDVSAKYRHIGKGGEFQYTHIQDTTIFSTTGHDAIVDWIWIELRSKSNNKTVVATRAALLQRDGDIVDLDGKEGIVVEGLALDSFYVAVRHRSHFGSITANPISPFQYLTLVDFSDRSLPLFDKGLVNGFNYTGLSQNESLDDNIRCLWAGDFDANGKIKNESPNDDTNYLFFDLLYYPTNLLNNANFDFAIGYFQSDYDMNSKAKFDNPFDDKNLLFAQIILYPLNNNLLSNFNFMVEQMP